MSDDYLPITMRDGTIAKIRFQELPYPGINYKKITFKYPMGDHYEYVEFGISNELFEDSQHIKLIMDWYDKYIRG